MSELFDKLRKKRAAHEAYIEAMKRHCQQCGGRFYPNSRKSKYCSRTCASMGRSVFFSRKHPQTPKGNASTYAERTQKMLAMKREGKTLDEVGTVFGITRERVRQLLEKSGEPWPKNHGGVASKVVIFECLQCKKSFTVTIYASDVRACKFCSRKCYWERQHKGKRTPQELLEYRRKGTREWVEKIKAKHPEAWRRVTYARNHGSRGVSYKDFV